MLLGVVQKGHAQEVRRVDFYQGPVINSNRVVGLGGAFTGVAEGADSHLVNPAALVVRSPSTADDWFDIDGGLSFFSLDARDQTDFDRSGRSGVFESANFAQAGFNLKFGRHGFGFHIQSHDFTLDATNLDREEDQLTYSQNIAGLGYAYAFWEGDLVVGGMLIGGNAEMNSSDGESLLSISGTGIQAGVLWAPCGRPFRLGASYRSEILALAQDEESVMLSEDNSVTYEMIVPSELRVGYSFMLGPRLYNVCPTFGDWEEKVGRPFPNRHLSRFYILVTLDAVLTGEVENGTGAQAFLENDVQPSGEHSSLSLRGGIESEVWKNRMVMRTGTYYEPNRFKERSGRQHVTGGFDLRVFTLIWTWKLSMAIDVADNYTNIGLGIGFWK
ncbi:MAG: hypothetical protein AAFX99_03155 [Myxococcota bacterium]